DDLVKERFITGLSEKDVFWRVNVSNPKTCSEAYDFVVQTYARLQILNNNQKNQLAKKKTGNQKNGYQEVNKHVRLKNQIDQQAAKLCQFFGKYGHLRSDCFLRKKQMNAIIPEKRKQAVPSALQKKKKMCLYCGNSGLCSRLLFPKKSNENVYEVRNENKKQLVQVKKLKNCFDPHGNTCNPTLADKSMVSQEKEKTELVSNAASTVKETHLEPSSTVVCDQESYWVVPNSEIVPEWLEEGESCSRRRKQP
ncbi:hypothetical protein BpHYR1_010472, partial [Brachionus plicatilis]